MTQSGAPAENVPPNVPPVVQRSSQPPAQRRSELDYLPATRDRAARALRCAPFLPGLYQAMRDRSVGLSELAGARAVAQGYLRQARSEQGAEFEITWLIQVGLLRREVDGQGITDSFRLTPLGSQILDQFSQTGQAWPQATWGDRWQNGWQRWLRLPF